MYYAFVSGKPKGTSSRLANSHIGMSSIGISLEELLNHEGSAVEEIIQFQGRQKLKIFIYLARWAIEYSLKFYIIFCISRIFGNCIISGYLNVMLLLENPL